ncbi:MAG: hypothetical protein KDD44_08590 [Bdellovibrionales bacterium]|nr:hypothetical protein [Bdellovibrionales bacterium]
MQAIEKHLQALGFSDKERRIFQALVSGGAASASLLGKKADIPRASVYAVLNALIAKGIISEERNQGTTLFRLNDPEAIVRLVDRESKMVAERAKHAESLLLALTSFETPGEAESPRLQFFEGAANVEAMLFDFLPEWRGSMSRTESRTVWGIQDPAVIEAYQAWHDHVWATKPPEERICIISSRSDAEDELLSVVPQRAVRFLSGPLLFGSSVWVCGEFVVVIRTSQQPHYSLLLKDPVVAANLRAVFQALWQTLAASE